jgi:hypothetical protein
MGSIQQKINLFGTARISNEVTSPTACMLSVMTASLLSCKTVGIIAALASVVANFVTSVFYRCFWGMFV